MKKPYQKPDLFLESFELSQSIADCGWELQAADQYMCHAVSDAGKLGLGFNLFQETTGGCHVSSRNFYCYQPGSLDDGLVLYKS